MKYLLPLLFLPFLLFFYFFQIVYFADESMKPSIKGQSLLLIKRLHKMETDERQSLLGEVVLYRHAKGVALGRITFIKKGTLYKSLLADAIYEKRDEKFSYYLENNRRYRVQIAREYIPRLESLEINLGGDDFYILGDNRDFSLDSRFYGPISPNNILGKVLFSLGVL